MSYLRGLRFNLEKKEHGGEREAKGQNDPLISTAKGSTKHG